jgi:hypothetical protein
VSKVRNDAKEFWNTKGLAIFRAAVNKRDISPITIDEEIDATRIMSTTAKACKRPRINPDLLRPIMHTSDFAVKQSLYLHVTDELDIKGIGYGLFSRKSIPKQTPMLVMQGELITTAEANAMRFPRNKYLIRVDDDRVLDSYNNVLGTVAPLCKGGRANDRPTCTAQRETDT